MNNENLLQYLLALLENKEYSFLLYNILNTMKISRNSNICSETFKGIDFGNYRLNDINFSTNTENGCTFENVTFNEVNFLGGHKTMITSMYVTEDEKCVITRSSDCIIKWDLDTCCQIEKKCGNFADFNMSERISGNTDRYKCVISDDCTFFPPVTVIAVTDSDGEHIKRLNQRVLRDYLYVYITADGRCVYSTGRTSVSVWNFKTGSEIILDGHDGWIDFLCINNIQLATGVEAGRIVIRENETGRIKIRYQAPGQIRRMNMTDMFIYVKLDDSTVWKQDISIVQNNWVMVSDPEKPEFVSASHNDIITENDDVKIAKCSPDNKYYAAVTYDGKIIIIDNETKLRCEYEITDDINLISCNIIDVRCSNPVSLVLEQYKD